MLRTVCSFETLTFSISLNQEEDAMKDIEMPHEGHEQHLCHLLSMRILDANSEEYKKLVRNAKYICIGCGRTAASEKNLCAPRELDSSD
jgi:hypothetical protein